MRKNLEKRLIWVVATALSLNGAPFMPAAQAQLSPATTDSNNQMMEKPASEAVEYAQGAENKPSSVPGTTLYRDYPGDEGVLDTATEDEPSELPMKTLKQIKADTVAEETKEPAAESSSEKPAESADKVKRLIEAGFEKTFGDVEVEILEKKIEIAEGMTPEMMESGGVPRNEELVVPFLVTFADGRVQKGEAQPIVVGPGGEISIAGVHMFNGPADESYIVPASRDGERNDKDSEILNDIRSIEPALIPPPSTGEKQAEPQPPFSLNDLPAGPMTPYTTPSAGNVQSDPDYTPLIVPSGESLIVPEDDGLYSSKEDISRDLAQEKLFAALPESEPIENVPQDRGMMTLEEAMKRKGAGEGTIKDIDPRNPSQSPCGGGTQIKSPGGEGPTAWFCPDNKVPESEGPATADFTPDEETVMSTESIPEPLKPETVIDTASESKQFLNQNQELIKQEEISAEKIETKSENTGDGWVVVKMEMPEESPAKDEELKAVDPRAFVIQPVRDASQKTGTAMVAAVSQSREVRALFSAVSNIQPRFVEPSLPDSVKEYIHVLKRIGEEAKVELQEAAEKEIEKIKTENGASKENVRTISAVFPMLGKNTEKSDSGSKSKSGQLTKAVKDRYERRIEEIKNLTRTAVTAANNYRKNPVLLSGQTEGSMPLADLNASLTGGSLLQDSGKILD